MRVLAVSFVLFYVALARKSQKAQLIANVKELLSGDFQIVEHDRIYLHEICQTLRCHHNEVCVLKGDSAVCVKKRHVEKYRSQRKPQFLKTIKEGKKEQKPLHELVNVPKHERKSTAHRFSLTDKRPECTAKVLQGIGERMLKWFGDIHRDRMDHTPKIPRHSRQCDLEVEWMFGDLDADRDGILSMRELGHIQDDPYEKCIKPFVDRCDQDGDDDIDIEEWCDCFTFVNHEEDEPLCHYEAHKIDPHDPDTFSPRCDVDGYYKVEQCFKDECWCVDKYGREFDRSRVKNRRPDCGQYAEDD